MDGIVAAAQQWLAGSKKVPGSTSAIDEHIIESLLAEIQRIEMVSVKTTEELHRLRTDLVSEVRLAVAEECAVICETADYVVRNYGCAREIRKHFGLSTK